MRNLENQIGQLDSALNNRPPINTQVPTREDAKECKVV